MTNPSVNHGRWTQLRGRIKSAWGKLTHDEDLRIEGNAEVVLGAVEQRLGSERNRVLAAIDAGAKAISRRVKRAR
jgi:uncharacterized protein YjbJ (UPF0337 family)